MACLRFLPLPHPESICRCVPETAVMAIHPSTFFFTVPAAAPDYFHFAYSGISPASCRYSA